MNEKILMKNGVALWLINNTDLSSEQIGEFCNIHPLQIEHMQYEGAKNIVECNPIASLILEEKVIQECEKDTNKRLTQMESSDFSRRKISNKTFLVHNAILWLLNKNPSYQASKIAKLLHCNIATVKLIQNKEFKQIDELTPQNPVANGLCSSEDLDIFINEN